MVAISLPLWRIAIMLFVVNLCLLWIYFNTSNVKMEKTGFLLSSLHKQSLLRSHQVNSARSVQLFNENKVSFNSARIIVNGLNKRQIRSTLNFSAPIDSTLLIEASKNATAKVKYEARVMSYANYYHNYKSEYYATNKTTLLCSTFIALDEANIEFIASNILYSNNTCDWLVIVYKYEEERVNDLIATFNKAVTRSLESLKAKQVNIDKQVEIQVFLEFAIDKSILLSSIQPLCEQYVQRSAKPEKNFNPCDFSEFPYLHKKSTSTTNNNINDDSGDNLPPYYNHLLYPKIVLFISYLRYVSKYHYIWSLDSDISLKDFDMLKYLNIVSCSYVHPPLVSQPLISPSTQTYSYLNHVAWEPAQAFQRTKNRTLLTAPSGFVEIQAPLFNAFYLEFFIMSFLVPLLTPTFILGGDWGYDEIFCKPAKLFLSDVLNSPFVPKSRDSMIPCALIIGGTPVTHVNKHTTDNIVGVENKLSLDCQLVSLVSHTFPSYSVGGNSGGCSPDNPNFIKIFELKNNCQFKY